MSYRPTCQSVGRDITKKNGRHDITGQRFNRLVAVELSARRMTPSGQMRTFWNFQCDCGKQIELLAYNVKNGHTQSCGCLLVEVSPTINYKHGATSGQIHGRKLDSLFTVWSKMLGRCRCKTCPNYDDYGGRGIYVDSRWDEYINFRDDMGPSYVKGLKLELIDNNGPYAKWNCRWATHKEQMRNTRANVFLCLNGERKCMAEWAEITGISYGKIQYRRHMGWSDERILTTH